MIMMYSVSQCCLNVVGVGWGVNDIKSPDNVYTCVVLH